MASDDNVLIVEDEEQWRKNYERAMRPEQTVKVAKDLAGAERLIDSTKFAVAFVDIGLDVEDDQNVDGLRVMQKIRDAGDETSIVVVTGRTGQDVLPITRNALKEYGAYDTIGKKTAGPSDIRRLLEGGLKEYRSKTVSRRTDARDAISTADAMIWDYQVTRAINFKGSVNRFYDFLDQLFGEYLPLVPRSDIDHVHVDEESRIVCGNYWSRAVAAGLLICFGSDATFDEALRAMPGDADILKSSGNKVPIKELVNQGVKGEVFVLEGNRRDEFLSG
jgi:ActR/RegA family two-component response regulator